MQHFSHKHLLSLFKYNNSPPHALCCGCDDPILINTEVYHCFHQSTSSQDSPCDYFFLHKTCAELPMVIQHHLHIQHSLNLISFHYLSLFDYSLHCKICKLEIHGQRFFYLCTMCGFVSCCKCVSLERELNHPSHNHTLTLLPLKSILCICTACGTEGREDFICLCKTCFFWIHESCASAPRELIRKDHDNDHPLVLTYSLPEEYRHFGVSCYLCLKVFVPIYWLYYCAECRYFAHVHCALTAAEFSKDGKENDAQEDVEGSNDVVHLPVSENEPHLLYQLIQQFANKFTISTEEKSGKADVISECRNGHPLTLFDDFNDKSVVETNTSDKRICDGCVLPLLLTPDPFYGCVECNFFLHNVCAAELPIEIQHTFHPKKELTRFTRCYPTSKPSEWLTCNFCDRWFNGIVYSDDSGEYSVDVVCAALPSKIKHDSHRHTLHQVIISDTPTRVYCRGCGYYMYISDVSYGCQKCDYYIHIKCALKPGTMKHRWDEHEVNLMYPPVKGHPHEFDCEFCSEDINPNDWFYHCSKCDTSFHTMCIYPNGKKHNLKYGGIVRDDSLHQHNLKFTITGANYPGYKCGRCGGYKKNYRWKYECESCKFSVCVACFYRRTD